MSFLSCPPSPNHCPGYSRAEGLGAGPVLENYSAHMAAWEGAQVSSFRWQVPFLSLCPCYVNCMHNQLRAINCRFPGLCLYSQQCLTLSRAMVATLLLSTSVSWFLWHVLSSCVSVRGRVWSCLPEWQSSGPLRNTFEANLSSQ